MLTLEKFYEKEKEKEIEIDEGDGYYWAFCLKTEVVRDYKWDVYAVRVYVSTNYVNSSADDGGGEDDEAI